MKPVRVGVIGCGNISSSYFETANAFDAIECVACADLDLERAQARAQEFGIPCACSVDELLSRSDIEIVINLTTPQAHRTVSVAALEAGKHVYTEKPLAVTTEDGAAILEAAEKAGLRIGCAPGTPLGAGLQTCRKLLDDGVIGQPVACSAFMMSHGHESWHPDPAYYYQVGAGPMFDMGPYYLTALTTLLGPISRVCGSTGIQIPERTITSKPKYGEKITVRTPDHVTGTMTFANGAIGTIITTFATWTSQLPRIEIYGTEGTLSVPDPNTLGGPIKLCKANSKEWEEIDLAFPHSIRKNMWGLGVVDMAYAIRNDRAQRITGKQAFHVLECMQALLESSEKQEYCTIESTFERPTPLPVGLDAYELDA